MRASNNCPMTQMRKKKLLNQEEVANLMGVDRTTVSKWETGKAEPKPSMLLKLARLYECTIEELIGAA